VVLFDIFELEGVYKRLEAVSHRFRGVRIDDQNGTHVGVDGTAPMHAHQWPLWPFAL
jgi:hypothetical protein